MWLRLALAIASRVFAGWPTLSRYIGSSGLAPGCPWIAWSIQPGTELDQFMPVWLNSMGLASTPATLPTSGARCDMGPPAWPLAMAASASRCDWLPRSSTMSPTVQLPSAMGPGVKPATTKFRPLSSVPSNCPRSTWNASAKVQLPFVGRAVSPLLGQGHRKSQLQLSMYSPRTSQLDMAASCGVMSPTLRASRGAVNPEKSATRGRLVDASGGQTVPLAGRARGVLARFSGKLVQKVEPAVVGPLGVEAQLGAEAAARELALDDVAAVRVAVAPGMVRAEAMGVVRQLVRQRHLHHRVGHAWIAQQAVDTD